MMVAVGAVFQTMRVQNKNLALSKLSEHGGWILSELKRNVFNSTGKLACYGGNLSIGLTNISDIKNTVLSCSDMGGDNQIASESAMVRKLNTDDVSILDCTNFVVCGETDPVTGLSRAVTFNFNIGTSVSGVGVSKSFTTTVTLRN